MKNSNQKGGGKKNATAKNATAKNAAAKNAAGKNAAGNAAQENINVMVFENPEFGRVRTMTDESGEPLFCGKDVCEVLGYAKTDKAVREHVSNLDVLKRYVWVTTGKKVDGSPAMRHTQMLFVNESGFYCLVFGSKLEAAQRFKHWVTSEVLPSIRKNGYYSMLSMKDKLIAEQDERIRDLDHTVDEQMVRLQRSAEEILGLEGHIDRLQPKALYTDNVLDSISCYTTTQIAKELGCTAQELNRSLCACHIQYYQSGQYLLYADFAHQGLAKSRTHFKAVMLPVDAAPGEKHGRVFTRTYLVWTEKGRKFIHDLAKRKLELANAC